MIKKKKKFEYGYHEKKKKKSSKLGYLISFMYRFKI